VDCDQSRVTRFAVCRYTLEETPVPQLLRAILPLVLTAGMLWPSASAQALQTAQADDPDARLRAQGLTLPDAAAPVANYVRAVRSGNLVFLAGHGECGPALRGKVGAGVSVEEAYASARRVGLCLLSSLKAEIGDLKKVKRIVKVLGMVNSAADFTDQPKVVNGCSDLLVSIFGDRGRHARSAVGMASLPQGIAVEIEMIVELAEP
jgi:enamine deaminase RidA (YjgF/YER057c/UK114 family)